MPTEFRIREFKARSDGKDAFRVQMSHTSLVTHRLEPGSVCVLETGAKSLMCIAWQATNELTKPVVLVSSTLRDLHDLSLEDRCTVQAWPIPVKKAQSVTLYPVTPTVPANQSTGTWQEQQQQQEVFEALEKRLGVLEYVAVGLTISDIPVIIQETTGKCTFKIAKIHPEIPRGSLQRYSDTTKLSIRTKEALDEEAKAPPLLLDDSKIRGLQSPIEDLKCYLLRYQHNKALISHSSSASPPPKGVLLHGPPGTGKSLIIESIEAGACRTLNASPHRLDSKGGAYIDLARVFDEAQKSQPCVVLIDSLDRLRDSRDDRLMTTFINSILSLKNESILIIATTTDPKNVYSKIQDLHFFDDQIEIPPPDRKMRAEILKLRNGLPPDQPDEVLDNLASRTNGYVGRDLERLVDNARHQQAIKRTLSREAYNTAWQAWQASNFAEDKRVSVDVTQQDYEQALKAVVPSVMQGVFVEVPEVRWTDIGGQTHIKAALQEAVEWPFKYPEYFGPDGAEPQAGLLLYGPPGCSKTLIARAIATEAGLNFLAVEGAELLSMYVGESERALREVFKKARAASPSILFFDEIDAVGAARDSQTTGLNMLTTLLTEMDGIRALSGTFVLAATNRPETLDSALMRPGRLTQHLYVGPPDRDAREEIFRIRLARKHLAEDVDYAWLAAETDGYSGAEVVSICRAADLAAVRDAIRDRPSKLMLSKKHFEQGMKATEKRITKEMVESYEAWGRMDRK